MELVWFIVTVLAGVGFYLLRCQIRWLYGLIEIIVALVIMFFASFPVANALYVEGSYGFGLSAYLTWGVITRLTGVYVLVRGLDNFEVGLPKSCQLHIWWKHKLLCRWPSVKRLLRNGLDDGQ